MGHQNITNKLFIMQNSLEDPSQLASEKIIKKHSGQSTLEASVGTNQAGEFRLTEITNTIQSQIQAESRQERTYQPLTASQKQVAANLLTGYKARKLYKSLRKDCKARRKGLEQLLQTQKDYRADLDILDNHLRTPLLDQKIITNEEERTLFPNFPQLKNLSAQLLSKLQERFSEYHFHQIFGDILCKQAPFYSMFIGYMNGYQKSWETILSLARDNPRVREILEQFKSYTKQKNDASSYLIKPCQRLPRYKLLTLPIIDKTNPEHPDYELLKGASNAFWKVTMKVNDLMERIIMNKKIQDLDKDFSTPKHPILHMNRRLLFEETAYWLYQGKILVNAYFFNDLVFFINAEGQPKKIIHRLTWTDRSSILNMADGKTMINVVNISCSDGNATLQCGPGYKGLQIKNRIIANVKDKMSSKSQQKVIVQALGTEEQNSTSLSKHTIYIMQVRIGPFRQNLFIRFKELLQILNQLQRHYKHLTLSFPQKRWFTSHKSHVIEQRKVQILQTLQTILNDTQIQKQPDFMISKLNLRQNFYKLPDLIEQRMVKSKQDLVETKNKKFTAFELLCATELQLGRYNIHGDEVYKESLSKEELFIDVKIMTGEILRIKITDADTVEDICNKASKRIGLTMNRDFRLFHQITKKESRVLDHDRIISKIFSLREDNQPKFLNRVMNTIVNTLVPDTRPLLTFKKYFYLPFKNQKYEYKRDLIRLKLWAYQVFSQVKDMKYQFSSTEIYFFFAATYLYAVREGDVESILTTKDVDLKLLRQMIFPDQISKIEGISQDVMKDKVLQILRKLDQEVSTMKNYNQHQNFNSHTQLKKGIKANLFINKTYLCYQIVMNKISSNFLFCSNIFYTGIHSSLNKLLPNIELSYNMWLAINLEGIQLLKPSSKEPVFKIDYNDIMAKTVHPSQIVFTMQNESKYRLGSYQSFEISQLIDYIKKLSQVIETTSNSGSGFSKEDVFQMSVYMSSLSKHRESYN